MTGTTHKVLGVALGTLLGVFSLTFNSMLGLFVILYTSTLPDKDMKLKMKHRGFSHSLLCLGFLEYIAYYVYSPMVVFVAIGYGGHILADSFTKMGVPFFYPYKKRIVIKFEWVICFVFLMLILHHFI